MIAPRNRLLLRSLVRLGSVAAARDPVTGDHLWHMTSCPTPDLVDLRSKNR